MLCFEMVVVSSPTIVCALSEQKVSSIRKMQICSTASSTVEHVQ